MKKMRVLFGLVSSIGLLSVVGCGGGGSGSSWNGPLDAAGFPAVAGTYSFTTDTVSYTCTDGESGQLNPQAFNVDVQESANALMITRPLEILPPNATLIGSTGLTGLVETDGSFTLTETAQFEITGIPGQVTANYSVTGQFTPNGGAGDYQFTADILADGITCTYTTTFTSDKLNS
jgi:hypothetical protein